MNLSGDNQGRTVSCADFALLRLLGEGSFGKVFQVRKLDTGRIYAMKVLRKARVVRSKKGARYLKTERTILEAVRHPFIVQLRYAFQTDGKLYLIMDYLNGGELFYHMSNSGCFSEDLTRFYVAEIVLALTHLHKLGIIYRDLKPENVCLDADGHVVLTDFGLAKEAVKDDLEAQSYCGTAEYMAPEIIKRSGHGRAVDWWSLGCLTYEMLTGETPFGAGGGRDEKAIRRKVLRHRAKIPSHWSSDAKSLVRGLLDKDYKKRLGSGKNDGESVMSHPFFRSIDWKALGKRQVPPPFKPDLEDGLDDVSNFDPAFTDQTPVDSPVFLRMNELRDLDIFEKFSYIAPTFMPSVNYFDTPGSVRSSLSSSHSARRSPRGPGGLNASATSWTPSDPLSSHFGVPPTGASGGRDALVTQLSMDAVSPARGPSRPPSTAEAPRSRHPSSAHDPLAPPQSRAGGPDRGVHAQDVAPPQPVAPLHPQEPFPQSQTASRPHAPPQPAPQPAPQPEEQQAQQAQAQHPPPHQHASGHHVSFQQPAPQYHDAPPAHQAAQGQAHRPPLHHQTHQGQQQQQQQHFPPPPESGPGVYPSHMGHMHHHQGHPHGHQPSHPQQSGSQTFHSAYAGHAQDHIGRSPPASMAQSRTTMSHTSLPMPEPEDDLRRTVSESHLPVIQLETPVMPGPTEQQQYASHQGHAQQGHPQQQQQQQHMQGGHHAHHSHHVHFGAQLPGHYQPSHGQTTPPPAGADSQQQQQQQQQQQHNYGQVLHRAAMHAPAGLPYGGSNGALSRSPPSAAQPLFNMPQAQRQMWQSQFASNPDAPPADAPPAMSDDRTSLGGSAAPPDRRSPLPFNQPGQHHQHMHHQPPPPQYGQHQQYHSNQYQQHSGQPQGFQEAPGPDSTGSSPTHGFTSLRSNRPGGRPSPRTDRRDTGFSVPPTTPGQSHGHHHGHASPGQPQPQPFGQPSANGLPQHQQQQQQQQQQLYGQLRPQFW